jgi:fructose-1,6-bisphosphatase
MYKYSKKAEEKFFQYPVFAFIFLCFALSQDGIEYTRSKLTKSLREDFGQEILDDISSPINKKQKVSH